MDFRRAIWHSNSDSRSASRLACVAVFETGPEVSAPTLGLLRADAGKPKAERAFMAADETRAHITPPRKRAGAEAPAGSPERIRGRSAGPLRHSCGRSFRPPGMGFHTVNGHLKLLPAFHILCIVKGPHPEKLRRALDADRLRKVLACVEPGRWEPSANDCIAHGRRAHFERVGHTLAPYGVGKLGCCHHGRSIISINGGCTQPHNLWLARDSTSYVNLPLRRPSNVYTVSPINTGD